LAALDSGLPSVCTIRDTAFRYAWLNRGWHPRTILGQLNSILFAWKVIQRSSNLMAVSEYTAQHVRRYFRYKGKIDVVPNPVWFNLKPSFAKHRFDPDRPIFTDISGWGRVKNVKTLLRAFGKVRKRIPGARLQLYGDGLEAGGVGEAWARQHRVNANVDFRGYASMNELNRALIEDTDIFTHLAVVETFGNSICESIAAGNPAVISNIGAGPGVLNHSESCRYVAPYDVVAATRAMIDVVERYRLCRTELTKLQQEMRGLYNPNKIAMRVCAIYERIIKRSNL